MADLEKTMSEKLQKIFKAKKVTFAEPGESQEQECLFIEVENCIGRIKDGREVARVSGNCTMFGNADKMPFNFFAKCIDQATADLKKEFAFFEFEQNTKIYQNIVQRAFRFVYFYDSQYDPDTGTITEMTAQTTYEVSE